MLIFLGSVSGSVEGNYQLTKISSIQFAWRTTVEKPEDALTIITEVPFEKAVFKRAEEPNIATVAFSLYADNFLKNGQSVDLVHPNNFLKPENLAWVRFTLPEEEFRKIPTVQPK